MREFKIERKLTDYCRKHKILCYKFSSPAKAGVPDRILIFPGGRIVFMELKATGQKPTALQMREIRRIIQQGAEALVFDDWSNIQRWLLKVGPLENIAKAQHKVEIRKFHYEQFI
jgi:hypothetical protein